MAPKGPHMGSDVTKGSPKGLKWPQGDPKWDEMTPKGPQMGSNGPKMSPKVLKWPQWDPK